MAVAISKRKTAKASGGGGMEQRNAWLLHVALIALSILFLFPLIWMASTSLKPINETMQNPPVLIPSHILWQNYPKAFTYDAAKLGYVPFLVYGRNTLVLCLLAVSGAVVSNALVAYAFARLKWPGRDVFFRADAGDDDDSVSGHYGSGVWSVPNAGLDGIVFVRSGYRRGSATPFSSFCCGSSL